MSKCILDAIEESVIAYFYEEIAVAYKVEGRSGRFDIDEYQKIGNSKFRRNSPIENIRILNNGTQLPFIQFNNAETGDRSKEYHIKYATDTWYDFDTMMALSDHLYTLSENFVEDKNHVYEMLKLDNTIDFKSVIEGISYYRIALLLEKKFRESGSFTLNSDFSVTSYFWEGFKTVNPQLLQFCQSTITSTFSEILGELKFDLTDYATVISREGFDEDKHLPLINFNEILSGVIEKESVLELLDQKLLQNEEQWFELYSTFVQSPIFYYQVLHFISNEILVEPNVLKCTFWDKAVKQIIDTMVDYQWFGAQYYEVSTEEFANFEDVEELDSTAIYYEFDYCHLVLIIELLRQSDCYDRSSEQWFEILEYLGKKYIENAPKEANVEEYTFGLAEEEFLSTSDKERVTDICKRYFRFGDA